jgi:hypothetical protein
MQYITNKIPIKQKYAILVNISIRLIPKSCMMYKKTQNLFRMLLDLICWQV